MLPYKSIKIESYNKIQKQLLHVFDITVNDYTTRSHIVDSDKLKLQVPELYQFFYKNNLAVDVIRFFVTAPNSSIPIHKDGSDDNPKFLALNLPILNCANSSMKWWSNVELSDIKTTTEYAKNIKIFDGENKQVSYQLELTNPHLVMIGIPHNVENYNNAVRIILSIRFKPEPLHLWY